MTGPLPGRRDYRAIARALIAGALEDLDVPRRADVAAAWFAGGDAPIPFTVAAELLDLDPEAVRDRLLRDGRLRVRQTHDVAA